MTTFLDLCNPFCYSLSSIPSEEGWDHISQLSKLHGVTAFLFYRTRSLGVPLPDRIKKEWLGYYLYNLAQEQRARRQIKELKEILDPEGIPMILLKGASAMMRLYPQPGLRTFVDLDMLIPADRVPRFKTKMVKAAYKPLGTMYSPEFEDIQKFDNHLDPYSREDSLTVEPHVSILGGMGDYPTALAEIWLGKESTSTDGIRVEHLGTEHFILNPA